MLSLTERCLLGFGLDSGSIACAERKSYITKLRDAEYRVRRVFEGLVKGEAVSEVQLVP